MKNYPVIEFEIWSYAHAFVRDSDAANVPKCIGKCEGRNFPDACIRFFCMKEYKRRMGFDEKDTYFDTFSTCYDAHRNELWGNPLFSSRQEAISSSVLF